MNKQTLKNLYFPALIAFFLIAWFILISLLGAKFINLNPAYNPPDTHIENISDFFYHYTHHWDTNFYKNIAQYGHNYAYRHNLAFFPLLPLEIKFIKLISGFNIDTSAIVAGNINFLIYTLVLFLFIKKYLAINNYNNFFLIFIIALLLPFAVFHQFIYTEALFNVLLLLIFYFLMNNKKSQVIILPLCAMGIVLTRNIGVIIIPSLLFYLYLERQNIKKYTSRFISILLAIISASFGVIGYLIYCWRLTGDAFYFMSAQSYWGRSLDLVFIKFFIGDLIVIFNQTKLFPHAEFCNGNISIDCYLGHLFSFAGLIIAVLVFILAWKKFKYNSINKSLILFSFLVMLVPVFSGASTSYNRYLLAAPIYTIFPAIFLAHKLSIKKIMLLINLLFVFYSFCLLLFINNYWVG